MSKKVFFVHFETKIGNAENIFLSVAKFCRLGGRTLLLLWHCIATAVGELCASSSTALPRQQENFAPIVALHCYTQKKGIVLNDGHNPPYVSKVVLLCDFLQPDDAAGKLAA